MERKILDDMLHSLLESTGGLQRIKQAIDTKDLASIVRAATWALRKTLSIPMVLSELKSAEMSNQFRKQGNSHYKNKDHREAILCYNKALAYAPNNSLELKLAYSNISAVMFALTAYRDCQLNIKAALELDCPEFLRTKLNNRMTEVDKLIMMEMMRDMMILDKDMLNYIKFDVKRNAEIPCASTDICIDNVKNVVAAKEIKSGTMVALERAFVSAQDEHHEYTSCYYCHKMSLFLIPCEGCCKALFCGKECRDKCLEDYHRIECHVVAYMGTMYKRDVNKLAVRAAIKMSLKLTWEELSGASLEMGEKRLKKSTVSDVFDHNSPVSVLCYNDQIIVSCDNMVHASLICAGAMYCLEQVPDYLPEEKKEREKAIDALSRIMLHLNTTFLRKIMISCSAFDYLNESYRCGVQRNPGWFSLSSKLPHSCNPNLLALGFNDKVALISLQRIKKGDQLTICYASEHFYDMNLWACPKNTRLRQRQIYNNIQFMCQCRVCLLEWHSRSHVKGTLTDRQKAAYRKCKVAMTSNSFKKEMKAISAALDEFTDERCLNTTQHYDLYGDLRRTLNICQCAKDLNRSYACVSKYVFQIE